FLAMSGGVTDAEPAYRLMRRLAHDHPTVSVVWENARMSPAQAAEKLRIRLADRSGLPVIGSHISHTVQVIEQWEPLEAVVHGLAGGSGDSLIIPHGGQRQIALCRVSAEHRRLHQLRA